MSEELHEAKQQFEATGEASRVFKDFTYQTRKSWSRARRVVGKAEHLRKGANPRFTVTTILSEDIPARELYEDEYCAGVKWRTASKNSNSAYLLIALVLIPCEPISCDCGSPPWPTPCCRSFGSSASREPSSPAPAAIQFD